MTGKQRSTYAQSFGSILLNPDLKDLYKGLKYSTFNLNFKFKESSDQVHADIKTVECVFIFFFFFFCHDIINNLKVSIPKNSDRIESLKCKKYFRTYID